MYELTIYCESIVVFRKKFYSKWSARKEYSLWGRRQYWAKIEKLEE